jgi:O-antigen/teichoic acid export membrane protein
MLMNPLSEKDLLSRCLRGGAALAAGSFFERGVRFIVNMILARLLAPEQFGLMALVLAAIGLFETLTEVGIQQAVVQNKLGETNAFLNVAWWFSGVRGAILYVMGVIAAPFVAGFYAEPGLTPLLRVAFLTMLFQGLINPGLYVLEKRLQFGRYIWIVQGSALLGTLLCLGMALWIPNVWALVIGVVAQGVLKCIGSFIFCPFRLEYRFHRSSWNELFRFSKGMVGLPLLTYIFLQADIFVLGKMCHKDVLGMYAMAVTLASMPRDLFVRIAGPMILPVLADSQDSFEQLRSRLLRMTRTLFLFGAPMITCLVVFSESILIVVYGAKYAPMAYSFGLLSVYTMLYVCGTLIASTYLALGRPDVHRWFTITRVMIIAAILYPAVAYFGPAGAAGARVVCMLLAGIVQQYNLSRLIGLPIRDFLLTSKEGLIFSAVLVIPAILVRKLVPSPLLDTGAAILLCGLVWGYILWTQKETIGRLFNKKGSTAE